MITTWTRQDVMEKTYLKSARKCNCHKITHKQLSFKQSRNVLQIYKCIPKERSEDLNLELPLIAFQIGISNFLFDLCNTLFKNA